MKRLASGDLIGRFSASRSTRNVRGTDEIGTLVTTSNALAAAFGELAEEYTAATDNLRELISGAAMASKSLAAAGDSWPYAIRWQQNTIKGCR